MIKIYQNEKWSENTIGILDSSDITDDLVKIVKGRFKQSFRFNEIVSIEKYEKGTIKKITHHEFYQISYSITSYLNKSTSVNKLNLIQGYPEDKIIMDYINGLVISKK